MTIISDVQWEAAEWAASLINDGYVRKAHFLYDKLEILKLRHSNGHKAIIVCRENEARLYLNGKQKKVYQHRLA